MASANETPRQKMIGMMYLLLTALLALNVSKEILNAFVVIDKSLANTNTNFKHKNEKLYSEFDLAKSVDPLKITPNWEKAQTVRTKAKELRVYIQKLKRELISKTEGIDERIADTLSLSNIQSKDDYDTPTNLMIGDSEDGSKGYSLELKKKIIAYESHLKSFIAKEDVPKINLGIDIKDPSKSENWEMSNFYHTPIVACVSILSKLESDIQNAESTVVDYLLRKLDAKIMKFDTIAPKVIPNSNYVLLGDDYKAEVFIAAFSKTQNPLVLAGENDKRDSLKVDRGIGYYTAATTREGLVKWSGTIKMKAADGKESEYPFKSEYMVAKPAATVSADKMNVFYTGVENPVSISVPGVPAENIIPRIIKGTGVLQQVGKGKYMVSKVSGSEVVVGVSAKFGENEIRNMGDATFRVKYLPTPASALDGKIKSGKITKSRLSILSYVSAAFDPDFVFALKATVNSYEVEMVTKGVISIPTQYSGNKIPLDLLNKFKLLKNGDRITFMNIKASTPDGIKTMDDISLKISN